MVKFQGDTMTIKDKYLRILSCLVILLLGMSLVPAASANSPPAIPCVFQGYLQGDAAQAGPGLIISAYMDSKLVASYPLQETGKYKVAISGTEKDNGKAITFELGGVASEPVSVTYKQGALPKNLDLTFYGDFIPPTIESLSASPIFILDDGKDFSTVTAKVVDPVSARTPSVTIDLTPIGQGVVPLMSEGGDLYTYNVCSTVAGKFKFTFKAANPSGSSVIDRNSISITVLNESQLATTFGGSDGVFSPEEIRNLINDNSVSSGIKYAVLNAYFANVLSAAPASAGGTLTAAAVDGRPAYERAYYNGTIVTMNHIEVPQNPGALAHAAADLYAVIYPANHALWPSPPYAWPQVEAPFAIRPNAFLRFTSA
jgi:hypothetical protein